MKKIAFVLLAFISFCLCILAQDAGRVRLVVTTDFDDSTISPSIATLNDRNIGESPFAPGKYVLKIQHPGFLDIQEEIVIPPFSVSKENDKEDNASAFTIVKKMCSLKRDIDIAITSSFPSGERIDATVILDGSTPRGDGIKPGRYELFICHPGFETIREHIVIPPGADAFLLERRMVALPRVFKSIIQYDVESAALPPCKITYVAVDKINDKAFEELHDEDKILPDLYRIKIERQGYQTWEQNEHVWPADSLFILQKILQSKPVEVRLDFTLEPSSASEKNNIQVVVTNPQVQILHHGTSIKPGNYLASIFWGEEEIVSGHPLVIHPSEVPYYWKEILRASSRQVAGQASNQSIASPRSLVFEIRDTPSNTFIPAHQILVNGRPYLFGDKFMPGDSLDIEVKILQYQTQRISLCVPDGRGLVKVGVPVVALRKIDFSLREDARAMDGISYPVSFEMDGKKVEPHHVAIERTKSRCYVTLWIPQNSEYLKTCYGPVYYAKNINELGIGIGTERIDTKQYTLHLVKSTIDEEDRTRSIIEILEKQIRKASFRKLLNEQDCEYLAAFLEKQHVYDPLARQRQKLLIDRLNEVEKNNSSDAGVLRQLNFTPTQRSDSSPTQSTSRQNTSSSDASNAIDASKAIRPEPDEWKPSSQKSNEARIYVGPNEQIRLQRLRVMVKIEGVRARTIVDHLFYNPYPKRLEGNFQYRLPDESSICYFVFYPEMTGPKSIEIGNQNNSLPSFPEPDARKVYTLPIRDILAQEQNLFGNPKMAYIVPRQKATEAYESVVRSNIDPGIMEWTGAGVFSAKVFPLLPQNYQRVVIAYEQTLSEAENLCQYKFVCPSLPDLDVDFLAVSSADMPEMQTNLPADSEERIASEKGDGLKTDNGIFVYHYQGKIAQLPNPEIVCSFPSSDCEYIMGKDGDNGANYLYARLKPSFPVQSLSPCSTNGIFLLDTSLGQQDNFYLATRLLLKILEKNKNIEKFNVLLFHIQSRWINPEGWMENTPDTRSKLAQYLDMLLLEGATDIENALLTLSETSWLREKEIDAKATNVEIFFLSDGCHTWGEFYGAEFLSKWQQSFSFKPRFYCYAMGQDGNDREFFSLLVKSFGNAIFSCAGEKQIEETAMACQTQPFYVEKIETTGLQDILFSGGRPCFLYSGQRILVASKIVAQDAEIVLHGTFCGQPRKFVFTMKAKKPGQLAPRAFGEIAVKTMENVDNPSLEKSIIAFCRHFFIPGKLCSCLMLEREEDYEAYKIDREQDPDTINKIKIDEIPPCLSPKERLLLGVEKIKNRFYRDDKTIQAVLSFLEDKDLSMPKERMESVVMQKKDVRADYLASLLKNDHDPVAHQQEWENRMTQGKTGDFVRCLSSLIEIAPFDTDTLYMTGHHLASNNLPGHALALFQRLKENRNFDPQPYMEIARCFDDAENYGTSALYYEIALAAKWDVRFVSIDKILEQEYVSMMHRAILNPDISAQCRGFFSGRILQIKESSDEKNFWQEADILVSLSWSVDNTDIDLWITEPGGEECCYKHPTTSSGGALLADVTRGYGPERYLARKAMKGKYRIYANAYAINRTKLNIPVSVNALVVTHAGTAQEKRRKYTVSLKNRKKAFVAEIVWPPEK